MTAACLLVRSPACSARQLQTSIVQVVHLCPTGFRKEPCERLERHKPKGLRVVLRGLGSSNAPRLPGGGGGDVTSLPDTWVGNHPGLPGLNCQGDSTDCVMPQANRVLTESRNNDELLRKSGPELAGWREKSPQTPMKRRGYTACGGACFRGAGPSSMAQTSARRNTVTRTGRRRRASEDVARETFCSTCSPRVGGNNTGYAATSGPD